MFSVFLVFFSSMGNYEIAVHFFEKIKVIEKKGNRANDFQYRVSFSKKKLKVSYCQENNFFQPKLARKVEKRQCQMDNGKYDVKPCREISE